MDSKEMLRLTGERMVVRDYTPGDLDGLHRWMGDPEVTHYLDFGAKCLEESLQQLATAIGEQRKAARDKYYLAIELRETGQIIGGVGLEIQAFADGGGLGDIGWMMQKESWGKGYATEAARLLLDYGFRTIRLHRITAWCVAENKASERVMQKCGMTREGTLRRHSFRAGQWRDRLVYAIMREEWV